jgi:hypothetical protein
MAAFRSRMASDIDVSTDAFIISGAARKTVNLAPLGHLHCINFSGAERNVGYFRDFRNTLADHIRYDISSSSMVDIRSKTASSDEKLRDNQANVFIALVLDVRRSAVSSIELAAPALRALQMLLQSQWQPTASFTHEFLEVVVSMLSSLDCGEQTTSITSAASISAIAEDIISTILRRGPKNTDFLLEVLFSGLRSGPSFVCTSAQVSILSQALGAYMKTSIPNIIHRLIQKTNILSKKELLGKNAVTIDTAWRKSLNLGDDLVVLSGAGTTDWMIASIVKIDYRTDSLTLEYRPPGAFLPGDEPEFLQLIQVSRSASNIKPLTYIDELTVANSMSKSNLKSIDTDDRAVLLSYLSEKKLSNPSTASGDIIYTVKRNHKLSAGILFDSMTYKDHCDDGATDVNSSLKNNRDFSPRCALLHELAVTSLEQIITHDYCSEVSLTCDCCGDPPSYNESTGHRGWYCDHCRYHMCFSCHPESPGVTLTMRLQRNHDVIEPLQLYHHKFPRCSSSDIFNDGDVVEVNSSFDNSHAVHYNHDITATEPPSLHDGNFYRLTDGSGYILRRPKGWSYNILTWDTECIDRSLSRVTAKHTVEPTEHPTFYDSEPYGSNVTNTRSSGNVMTYDSSECKYDLYGLSNNRSDLRSDSYHTKTSSPVVPSAVQEYRISDLVEHVIMLDKVRKSDITGSTCQGKSPESGDQSAKDKEKETSVIFKLLTCALSVFEKVRTLQLKY